MTLQTTGHISLNNINGEFSKGRDFAPYHGVKFYKPSTSTLGNFSTNTLHMSDFYGTQNGIIINITISSDTQNYVLSPSNGSVSPTYVAGFTTINLTINSGIYVGSTSTGTYSLTVTGFTTGDTINIINNGIIIGCGGNGGNGTGGAGNAGAAGGNALTLTYASNITNNGTIAGGGGGGGASDGGSTYGSCLGGGHSYNGNGGGGGAGYNPGSGGSGDSSGSSGTRTAGGAGAATGGGPGLAGGTSNNGRAGGAAGNYIVGSSYANWIVTGTRLGGSL